ncbi:MAG: secondary thiamine-phosphate synthase enzyme YjbQ [Gammaproteobacteria bacterium]|nr:secondary thiamine-phosphate synthase enzyme YjbQ [Gammaproteobacteria bacterium]NNJ93232.1 YjbQ family protein [Halobacteria archaeon]
MKFYQASFEVRTRGRGSLQVTDTLQQHVAGSGISQGLCHVFLHHTSASLVLCENADPAVRTDMERFMLRLAPDGDPLFEHVAEGPDDMPAHIRTLLTHTDLTLPVGNGHCSLGTWQGVYLWEHRQQGHRRQITVSVTGV